MPFSIETSVPAITVFIQGLISFFSPCVIPLIPLYVSYFAGGSKEIDIDGTIYYPRAKVMLNTIFFVLGISAAFFILGFGFTALGSFFSNNRIVFANISGAIMILFGLYQLGVFGSSMAMESEKKLPLSINTSALSPLAALALGFTFSFAWTPCIGPILGSVLLMAGSSETALRAFLLIGTYTLGFVIPFIFLGLFTGKALDFFKKNQNIVKYSVKVGAILMIFMGIMTLTGFMNNLSSYIAKTTTPTEQSVPIESEEDEGNEAGKEDADEIDIMDFYDFTLTDQYGNSHTLSDYKGKTVFLNFWATWCPPCRQEMPEIQTLYEKYGSNEEDLIVIGIAAPNYGREGSEDKIKEYLSNNNLTFPVVMDIEGETFEKYEIYSYPTTFMISADGSIYGYVEGALTLELMESIVKQTMENTEE